MAFMLNKDGAFLVKGSGENTKFCTTCCGRGGSGPIVWDVRAYIESSSQATCQHRLNYDESGTFRTKDVSQPTALAGVGRWISGMGYTTHDCPTDSGEDQSKGCASAAACCDGTKVLFSNGAISVKQWADSVEDAAGVMQGAFIEVWFDTNDCDGTYNNDMSVRLKVTATQRK